MSDIPWIQTHSGRKFPLVDPAAADVFWPDVGYHLAHINRFAGAAGTYSVAQHSLVVAQHLPPEIQPYGLLHDAHEFAINDITTPTYEAVRYWLESVDDTDLEGGIGRWVFSRLKDNVDKAIFEAAGLPWPMPKDVRAAVKAADIRAMMTERRDLLAPSPQTWKAEYEAYRPFPEKIVAWHPMAAYYEFTVKLSATLGLTLSRMLPYKQIVASKSNTDKGGAACDVR